MHFVKCIFVNIHEFLSLFPEDIFGRNTFSFACASASICFFYFFYCCCGLGALSGDLLTFQKSVNVLFQFALGRVAFVDNHTVGVY